VNYGPEDFGGEDFPSDPEELQRLIDTRPLFRDPDWKFCPRCSGTKRPDGTCANQKCRDRK
jgi:hypothetical protein